MIIGITGTLGSGKGTVVDYLVKTRGFKHYSMSGFIREEILRRGLAVSRDTYTVVGDDIRAKNGAEFMAMSLCKRAIQTGGDSVVEALQSVGEAEEVRKNGGKLWAIDANPHIRYERIQLRKSEKDSVSFEDFIRVEKIEMESTDPARHNIGHVMQMADMVLTNNGAPEELYQQVEVALAEK